jgi:hypothetical protein
LTDGYLRSGQTQRHFCDQAGISVCTLRRWLTEGPPVAVEHVPWVEAPNLLSAPAAVPYTVRMPGGVVVEIAPGFREEEMARLLRAARSL